MEASDSRRPITLKISNVMKKFCLAALALVCATAFWQCSNDDPADPDPVPPIVEDPNFTLSVSDITTTSCKISVSPAESEMTYITMLVEQSVFDAFSSDSAYIQGDLDDFNREAESLDLTLGDLLESSYLRRGDLTAEVGGLQPSTDYYLYAYGLTAAGEVLTPLEKTAFTTESVPTVEIDFDIAIEELTTTSCRVVVTAEPSDAPFFFNLIDEAAYRAFGGDESAFAAHMKQTMVDVYLASGRTIEEIFANMSSRGTDSDTFTGLRAGKKYYVFAIGVNELFQPNSEPAWREISTESVAPSSNTFDIRYTVSYDGISGEITPSNDDQYVWCLQTKEDVDLCYANDLSDEVNDEEVMYLLVSRFAAVGRLDELLHSGVAELAVDYLQPESDYYLLVYGWDGAPTTALTKLPVHTISAESDPTKLTLSFEISDITHNEATVVVTPNCGVYYYFDKIEYDYYESVLEETGSVDETVLRLVDESIEYGAEWFDMPKAEFAVANVSIGQDYWRYNDLEPLTSYVVFGCSLDLSTGEAGCAKGFVSEPFTTTERVVSAASLTFSAKWYDGNELAALDPDKYGDYKGAAMLCYTVEPNAEAAHWYTNIYDGDYYSEFDDDSIIMTLVTYGYEAENWDGVSMDSRGGSVKLAFNMDYSFLGIAKDADGNYGRSIIEAFKLTREGASPASELLGR